MSAAMPVDRKGRSVQVLAIKSAQNITVGGTSAAVTSAFAESTQIVRVAGDTDCWIAWGTSPTAATDASNGSVFLPSGAIEFYRVGKDYKVAAIQDSAAGTLSVGEME